MAAGCLRPSSDSRSSLPPPRSLPRVEAHVLAEHLLAVELEPRGERAAGEDLGEPVPVVLPHFIVGDAVEVEPGGWAWPRSMLDRLAAEMAREEDGAVQAVAVGKLKVELAAFFQFRGGDADLFLGFAESADPASAVSPGSSLPPGPLILPAPRPRFLRMSSTRRPWTIKQWFARSRGCQPAGHLESGRSECGFSLISDFGEFRS